MEYIRTDAHNRYCQVAILDDVTESTDPEECQVPSEHISDGRTISQELKQILGANDFQGRSWRGFHHHMAVVLLTQAFVAEQRLETGEEYAGFDSFEEVAQ